jgi:hypothetical protein
MPSKDLSSSMWVGVNQSDIKKKKGKFPPVLSPPHSSSSSASSFFFFSLSLLYISISLLCISISLLLMGAPIFSYLQTFDLLVLEPLDSRAYTSSHYHHPYSQTSSLRLRVSE